MRRLFKRWFGGRPVVEELPHGVLPRDAGAVEVVHAFLRDTLPPVSDEFCQETAKALLDRLSRNGFTVERRRQ